MGMLSANDFLGTEGCDDVLRYRVSVSLNGVCFFWIEPVRAGVGGEFSGGGLLGRMRKIARQKVLVLWRLVSNQPSLSFNKS